MRSTLFFDETNALGGSRREVKYSHEGYVNSEIYYLPQRMESHRGPTILATNTNRNIDRAFIRRLSSVIDFLEP